MTKWILTSVAMLAATLPAMAALPPQYQRQAELQAVLVEATELFGIGHLIESIVMIGRDVYEVTGDGCSATMTISDVPPKQGAEPMVGPRQFTVEAGELACD